jgi:2-polyprenyl-3-methyl-5-hydroxy-6-metoxy-1,4-benzoquinol methylase
MSVCEICNLCENPGTLQTAVNKGQVTSDVRRFMGERFTVWRCNNCNSVHSAADVDLNYYYSQYPLKKHTLDFPTRVLYGNRLRLLEKQGIAPSCRILDYGCGAGVFVEFLREKGYTQAYGYDAYVPAFADKKVLGERYDAVVSFDVIEHADDPRQLLSDLRNLAHPQGVVLVATPNADYLPVPGTTPPDLEMSQPYHRHILSRKVLLDLGQKLGMKAVKVFRRNPVDSFLPGMNIRFMWTYIKQAGGYVDAGLEPMRLGTILRSPSLLFYALFGALFPPRANMMVVFRKQ